MHSNTSPLKPVADPTRLVKLHYTVKYVECDLAEKRIESKPVLQMYLSNHFVRDQETGGVVNIHLDEDNLEKEYKGTLIGTLHRKHMDISPTAAIGLSTYVVHRNDSGYACYVNAGTSNARIGTVMEDVRTRGAYDHNHDLIMRTVIVAGIEPVKKGVIELRIDKVELGPAVKLSQAASCLQAPMPVLEQSISSYIQQCMDLESSLPDLLPNVERVRAPYDLSQSGIESTGQVFLPVAAFAMQETPKANEEYFMNAFERVMARRNMKLTDYNEFDTKEKARTMASIICYAVQSFDYIGDAVELGLRSRPSSTNLVSGRQHVGTDEFSNIINCASGDCEDGACGIGVTRKAFINTPFTNKALLEMQDMCKNEYTYMMTLSVVHGAKIGDQEGFGAHMYGLMVPNATLKRALERSKEGKLIANRLAEPVDGPGEIEGIFSNVNASKNTPSSVGSVFPFMFCEGTGKIDPIGYQDPILEQRKYIAMHMRSVAGFKKEIPHEECGPSPFYYANLFAISDDLIEQHGVNVGGFVFASNSPASGGGVRRGAFFTDMLQQKDNLVIIPQPTIPEQTMQIMREAISLFPPPRPLVLDKTKPLAGQAKHPLWDKFIGAVKKFGRSGPDTKFHPSVDCFVRPHQFNENVVNMMISEAAQMPLLYDAAYEVEHMTNELCTYRVRLWVKPSAAP